MKENVASDNRAEVAVGASYNGKVVNVRVGDVLAVKLESNPTTGYKWQLKGISDRTVLQSTGSRFIAAGVPGVGAAGKEVWTFNALKKGKGTLTMEYLRSWESDVPAEKTFALMVVVG